MDEPTAADVVKGSKDVKEEDPAKLARRRELRAANLQAHSSDESESAKLDSSLKRHTAFLKRIKLGLGAESLAQNVKDIQQLSLTKYIEEIVAVVPEGAAKCKNEKDAWAAVETISALHQRFPTSFTHPLSSLLATALAPSSRTVLATLPPEQREKEESARLTRQRPLLRVAGELWLVGVLIDPPEKEGSKKKEGAPKDGWLFVVLKELLATDRDHANVPLLTSFVKHFYTLVLGLFSAPAGADPLIESATQERFRALCTMYYETLARKLVKEHTRLQEQDRRNHEAYIRSGEIFEDRQQAYEKFTKAYEKLLSSTQTLSDLLRVPMPELPTAQTKGLVLVVGDGQSAFARGEGEEYDSAGGKWEDEESKRFYEDVLDLADLVPAAILGTKKGEKVEEEKEKEKEKDEKELEKPLDAPAEVGEAAPAADGAATTEEPEDAISAGPAAQLNALFARLPDLSNRAMIDQAAVDFAFLNSKAARKRAVKTLGSVPRNRPDVLPYYARFTAILNRYMPDIGKGLIELLDDEFRYLQRKKNVVKELAESRAKNARFYSELTKFGVAPSHSILHCYKVLLDDFTGPNIDMFAVLLESCGRYLLRTEETSERMKSMLDLMRRKQAVQHLDQRQQLMLENAFYQCNPPERAAREVKARPPMELFIRHLIYDVLMRKTLDKVSKLLRKLHWEDPEVFRILMNVFTKVWKVKFGNISLLAILVYDMQKYHQDFAIGVVDKVLDDIRTGMERNIFKYNQRRIAAVKYLGELYNYRVVGSAQVFDTLWSLLTFGHPDGRPLPGQNSPLDSVDDFFRVRLVCTLLDTCGTVFDRGSHRKKLDNFLTFFQMYIFTKTPMPMDVDFMVTDTLEQLRPKLVMFKSFEEAAAAVDELLAVNIQAAPEAEAEESESDGESDAEAEPEHATTGLPAEGEDVEVDGEGEGEGESESDDSDDDESDSDVSSSTDSEEEDEEVVVLREKQAALSREEEDEFARELAKMVTDASDSRRVERRAAPLFDLSLPIMKRQHGRGGDEREDGAGDDAQHMKFTLLTKKGNKQQTRTVDVPVESALAVNSRAHALQDKHEQEQLKKLVLEFDQRAQLRQEDSDRRALEATLRQRGMKITFE